MIPTPRRPDHDRLTLADGHIHAGQPVTIVQSVAGTGYIVRIGNDPTRITPQYVAAEQIIPKDGV